ncbi:MAG: hypothetical protein P8X88_07460 [Gammaproteobacteria bacterium]
MNTLAGVFNKSSSASNAGNPATLNSLYNCFQRSLADSDIQAISAPPRRVTLCAFSQEKASLINVIAKLHLQSIMI